MLGSGSQARALTARAGNRKAVFRDEEKPDRGRSGL